MSNEVKYVKINAMPNKMLQQINNVKIMFYTQNAWPVSLHIFLLQSVK